MRCNFSLLYLYAGFVQNFVNSGVSLEFHFMLHEKNDKDI